MKDIKNIRREIDKVDDKISSLLAERRELVTEISRYKKSQGLEIFDNEREMEILKKANVYDGAVFRAILDASKDYQAGIINAGTFGLISGKEIKSLSPLIHSFWGDYEYRLCPVSEDELPSLLKNLAYDGFNITMPYKKRVFTLCDQLSPECYALGNVNTVKREIDGSLTGYNTDYFGFQYIIEKNNIDVPGKKVAILGKGGAAYTCKAVLTDMGASNIELISRNGESNYQNLDKFKDAEIIVNATPVGMYPNNGDKPISLEGFNSLEAVVDVIYNPYKTALILEAEDRDLKTATGLEMLVAQAGKAAEIFCKGNLEEGDIEDVIDKVLAKLLNRCLIGMPGSGKSFMGRRIANVQGLKLMDTDRIFISRHGMVPKDYIEEYGIERFKVMENQILKDVTKNQGQVIATGEGVIDLPENKNLLRQNGVVIHITRDLEKLSNHHRPPLKGTNMEKLLDKRNPIYEAWSDFDISNNVDFRKSFLVINGPNLNLLGTREPDIYGVETYADLENYVNGVADDMNISVEIYQSNHEGEIVDKIQEAAEMYDGIVINPAGYGYTSVAILDALKAVALPCCEVHLTNIEEREEFRRKTLTGSMAVKVISGMGFEGYRLALETLNG